MKKWHSLEGLKPMKFMRLNARAKAPVLESGDETNIKAESLEVAGVG